jgi:anti-anti-sigma factor
MSGSPDFRLERRSGDREGVALLVASGDIDMTASREFGRRLEGALRASPGDVVLDLVEVVHLDSTALRALLAARNLAEERGTLLVLVCVGPVLQVLDVTGLTELFAIQPDRESALAAIGRPSQPKR